MSDSDEKIKKFIENGAEYAGVAIGGALGFLAGGPVGAAGAAVAGVLLTNTSRKIILDFANRHLSSGEEMRVSTAAAFALNSISDRLKDGEEPRNDGFFASQDDEKSSAEELFEGVLLKSKGEHEEKKVRLLGNFFANLAFSPDISAAEANHLLKIAEDLTYRQICLLTLFHYKPHLTTEGHLRQSDYADTPNNLSHETISLIHEILEMWNKGLLVRLADDGVNSIALLSWPDIAPDLMMITSLGENLSTLLSFDTNNAADIQHLVSQLI